MNARYKLPGARASLWVTGFASVLLAVPSWSQSTGMDAEVAAIQQSWAQANYSLPNDQQKAAAFDALTKQAADTAHRYPDRAEPLIWEGIVLSSYAGAKGGIGSLGIAKQARARLLDAVKRDPQALQGSAYTSLGVLYHKVPGFPLGFGDDGKAREYLQKALQLNPDGIDPNFFYGQYLYETGDPENAVRVLEKALAAAPRPGRELADSGRRKEVTDLLQKARAKAAD